MRRETTVGITFQASGSDKRSTSKARSSLPRRLSFNSLLPTIVKLRRGRRRTIGIGGGPARYAAARLRLQEVRRSPRSARLRSFDLLLMSSYKQHELTVSQQPN